MTNLLDPVEVKIAALRGHKDSSGNVIDVNDDFKLTVTTPKRRTFIVGQIIITKSLVVFYKKEKEKQIFRKTNAWSIQPALLDIVDQICYETESKIYSITTGTAKEFGEYFHFSKNTEKKIYVPLEYWRQRPVDLHQTSPTEKKLRDTMGDDWYSLLQDQIKSKYMRNLAKTVAVERTKFIICPNKGEVFRAFQLTQVASVKVVILGQDPYPDREKASGLAFGFRNPASKPSGSLETIRREVERSCYEGLDIHFDPTLTKWAKQGVLLLNTSLTVREGAPKSHSNIGWEKFVKNVLYRLFVDSKPKVFLLWGTHAQQIFKSVEDFALSKNKFMPHESLTAKHPAHDNYKNIEDPCYPKSFQGCNHFVKANTYLKNHSRTVINW